MNCGKFLLKNGFNMIDLNLIGAVGNLGKRQNPMDKSCDSCVYENAYNIKCGSCIDNSNYQPSEPVKPEPKCNFEKDGYCYALGCYSKDKCNARDSDGNPKYADIVDNPKVDVGKDISEARKQLKKGEPK